MITSPELAVTSIVWILRLGRSPALSFDVEGTQAIRIIQELKAAS